MFNGYFSGYRGSVTVFKKNSVLGDFEGDADNMTLPQLCFMDVIIKNLLRILDKKQVNLSIFCIRFSQN